MAVRRIKNTWKRQKGERNKMKMRVHTYFKRCMVFFATLCVILISNHSVTWAASVQGNSPMLMVDKYTVAMSPS